IFLFFFLFNFTLQFATWYQLSKSSLQSRLQTPYDVLHLATRNQLERNVEQSRLTLGTQEITLLEFEQLLQQRSSRITFLNLSACDTATGNPAAVLGLTGIGFRTGIDNTMGSLWAVSDQSTVEFMIEFYRHLQQTPYDFSESLRQAQIQAINQDSNELRPFSWAGFILLTNHYE
ncbi:CHAT domain-containing protein, partial [Chroococcus sp. FPU101]|uniref:CHAT domain-containing protein n=1 Tax=Chroococcus sp. FPU101 TaxID=1974212 RepID=UPI001A8C042D